MLQLNFDKIIVQTINDSWITNNKIKLDVLRLDEIHGIISGNKYFKLKYYLQEAKQQNKSTIATFGGAYSNHIIATAFVCRQQGLQSIGFIRGEKPSEFSHTLLHAEQLSMELRFVSREEYSDKEKIIQSHENNDWLWVQEGGYGIAGAKGASGIYEFIPENNYDYIVCAVGTGTMMAGLVLGAKPNQQIIGISSMKGNASLKNAVSDLIGSGKSNATFNILHDYHFGGYGKHPTNLIEFINQVYQKFQLPLDIIYTSKAFYAIKELAHKDFFDIGAKVLFIHSGGLQGNASLSSGVLSF